MSYLLEKKHERKGLRALDLDLPFLASEAAIDIDNLLSNRSRELTAIRLLADQLRNSIEISSTGEPPRSLMDPATLTILGEAVARAAGEGYSRKVDDLLAEAVKIGTELTSADPSKNLKELERAREFCVALSTAVVAYHKSISDLNPQHPFRR
ncbi:MAG: hypothetical protein A2010_14630 [Nitrospirae bacterium GWD2_57_9]|nr:MAG: hypothetical protein A2010_14630 [Nitrospirae bacterium GWD2_57_9]